jgi:cyclophilin family peptidyl-prolyl cis-trans isomerase
VKNIHTFQLHAFRFLSVLVIICLALAGCGAKNQGGASSATPAGSAAAAVNPNAPKSWSKPPAMTIDTNKIYNAEITTSKGTFTIELFAKDAPKTVNNFVFLAKEGYYNGVPFHRIIETFMIQTGDPTGTGRGNPGYQFEDELNNGHTYDTGIVAMANSGKNTNGSQFFICTGPDSKSLNSIPDYTIFGKVSAGMDTVQAIAKTPVAMNPNSNDQSPSMPKEIVTINAIKITVK